jgi:hypothetical protein
VAYSGVGIAQFFEEFLECSISKCENNEYSDSWGDPGWITMNGMKRHVYFYVGGETDWVDEDGRFSCC